MQLAVKRLDDLAEDIITVENKQLQTAELVKEYKSKYQNLLKRMTNIGRAFGFEIVKLDGDDQLDKEINREIIENMKDNIV